MNLDKNELVELDLKLMLDYSKIIPKIQIGYDLFNLIDKNTSLDEATKIHLKEKAVVCHQKLRMMLYANECAIKKINEFEFTQNMDMPCLFGADETMLLYHTESTILFARNALDVVATIFHHIAFKQRKDSFNDFTKKILSDKNDKYVWLKSYLCELEEIRTHPFRLLCGITKGRSLRDQIIHQMNIKLEYDEYKGDSEKEMLFIVLYKGEIRIPYRMFMMRFVIEVIEMISYISQNFTLDE